MKDLSDHYRIRFHLLTTVFTISILSFSIIILILFFKIEDQKADIKNLTVELNTRIRIIENQTIVIQNLTSNVENLKLDIKSKETAIADLSNKLGLAETEIELLKPKIKRYYAAGVNTKGEGVIIPLEISVQKGKGAVSVNIKNVDLQSGAQSSVRTATQVAAAFSNEDLTNKDIIVSFINELGSVVSIDGPSAGSVMTVALVAVFENKTINDRVLMTGTIEPDGSIGQVGSVQEKARAAKQFGATTFIIPPGQSANVDGLTVLTVGKIEDAVKLVLS